MTTTKPSIASSERTPTRSNRGPAPDQSLDRRSVEPGNNAPGVVQAILQAAQTHYQKEHIDAARDFLALLEPLSAHTAETLETMGNFNFLLGEFEPAAGAYRLALQRRPDRAALWLRLALTSQRLNDGSGLQLGLDRALALEPENLDALKLLGDTHLSRGNYRDAAMVYGKLIGRHPNQAELFLLLAKCFFEIGDRATTRSALEHALEIDPGNQTALDNLRALRRQSAGEGTAPAPAQRQGQADATAGNSGLPAAAAELLARADAAYANDHLPAACELIKQALRSAPRSVQLRVCLGNLQFQLADYAGAFESYQQACASEPDNVDSLVRLAATALRVNQIETFEQSLRRALELDPENPETHRLLADANYSSERYSDAAEHYRMLLDQAPNDPELLLRLGNCRYKLDDLAAARQCFERVLEINPLHVIARENLQKVNEESNAAPAGVVAGSGWSSEPAGATGTKGRLPLAMAAP